MNGSQVLWMEKVVLVFQYFEMPDWAKPKRGPYPYGVWSQGMRSKYQIQGEFTVVQHQRDIQVLHALKEHFGCGSVAVNHGDRYHFRVKNLEHLLRIIIPFFEKYPLNTVKKLQLPVFKEICEGLKSKKHLTDTGFEEIRLLVKKLSDLKKIE